MLQRSKLKPVYRCFLQKGRAESSPDAEPTAVSLLRISVFGKPTIREAKFGTRFKSRLPMVTLCRRPSCGGGFYGGAACGVPPPALQSSPSFACLKLKILLFFPISRSSCQKPERMQ
ncbi:hypothetical protein [Rhizobium mongolense]|uniref:Uncharacterized protein n=1 Tax=Rhizobium mongolense TaxID=57676 RepID=A0A7W6WH88_9HYPH|nr:hypothetical protein [Rhizobium mongolense]MBB4277448.1 hypothetical protein [Rhizobium mongolense]